MVFFGVDYDYRRTNVKRERKGIYRKNTWASFPFTALGWALLDDLLFEMGSLFEIIFANSRDGLIFNMNAANIEMDNYKTISKTTAPIFDHEIC